MIRPKGIFVARAVFLKRALNFRFLLILVILGFTILTFLVKQNSNPYFKFDLYTTLFIQKFNPIWLSSLMMLVTWFGNSNIMPIVLTIIAGYGYLIGKRKVPLMLIISVVGGYIIGQIFKILVSRPRPDPLLVHQIDSFLQMDSFPSGHVLGAVSLYGFLLYIAYTQLKKGLLRNLVIVTSILMIILMGLSRIYLGAHWLSDVLGAYLLGFIWLSGVIFVFHKLHPKVNVSK